MNIIKKGITGNELKLFGVVLMVIDHIHQMFEYAGVPTYFSMIGRLVLPIFLFTLSEGFHYTRDKGKYLKRLFIGALSMNILNILISRLFPMMDFGVVLINNVFMTMFISAIFMLAYDRIREKKYLKAAILVGLPLLATVIGMVLMGVLPIVGAYFMIFVPNFITLEGGVISALLGLGFYIFRDKRWVQYLLIILAGILSASSGNFTNLFTSNFQWMLVFSIIPIALYNGQKGGGSKYFFYIFYPAHIYILYILSYLYANYFM
ncbi:TraX family protein [Streptococcaceae bacterium ESL0729]|nr:TraX family protein [Streptococcaceae bacterium ESL0729]